MIIFFFQLTNHICFDPYRYQPQLYVGTSIVGFWSEEKAYFGPKLLTC